jgi:hypothetical protein
VPFTADFTVSQALDGSTFTITDTSNYGTEGKGTFSSRTLTIYLYNGTTMNADGDIDTTPTAIPFSFASYTSDLITIPIVLDYAFTIVLTLVSTNPQGGSTYTNTQYVLLPYNLKNAEYGFCQYAAAQRNLFSNKNFFNSLNKLQTLIDAAETGISYSDVWSAQLMINEGYKLINNPSNFY